VFAQRVGGVQFVVLAIQIFAVGYETMSIYT
jgi:hypothetical protein